MWLFSLKNCRQKKHANSYINVVGLCISLGENNDVILTVHHKTIQPFGCYTVEAGLLH